MPRPRRWLRLLVAAALVALLPTAQADDLPGADSYPAELSTALQAALRAQGEHYKPRTEHLNADGSPRYTNRLIGEDSPYLLQHAHNPVNWFPWGAEAFALAKRQNKPIFLSIGYSTCHWCHVMEKESFENIEVARLLNQQFVAIKVDRERRPDVDEVYMTAVQLFTGSGGWPMSNFLTPEAEPFYGGTYYPRENFLSLLQSVVTAWRDHQPELRQDGQRMAQRVQRLLDTHGNSSSLSASVTRSARNRILRDRDELQGGFGSTRKFPHEAELLLLLDLAGREHDKQALETATEALRAMALGGIHDQVGGGFHRYSTTPDWLIPHFEEMLYNQAMLARAYLKAWQLTGERLFADTTRQVLDYVLRDMRDNGKPGGAFYSATDADSEGEEGKFFLWTPAQIRAALPPADAALIMRLFDVTEHGNFEGANILHLQQPLPDAAAELGTNASALRIRVRHALGLLYQVREQRVHPHRDQKRVTAWNGMLITTLAEAGRLLPEPRYLQAAERGADAILSQNRQPDGGLWRVNLNGNASVPGKLDDYAHMIVALLALYDADRDPQRLQQAEALADQLLRRFSTDPQQPGLGGFYMAEPNGDPLPLRPKQSRDGAVPSGNSVALQALAGLAIRSGKPLYRNAADTQLSSLARQVSAQPDAYPFLLIGARMLNSGEYGALQYAAAGKVRIDTELLPGDGVGDGDTDSGQPATAVVHIDIADGWHINAHTPRQPDLIGTSLTLPAGSASRLGDILWPAPVNRRLGFIDTPLALYQGRVTLRAPLLGPAPGSDTLLQLRLQACSDKVCLPPEALQLPIY